MDINNLTVVEKLTLNAIRWLWYSKYEKDWPVDMPQMWDTDLFWSIPEKDMMFDFGTVVAVKQLKFKKRKSLNNRLELLAAYRDIAWPKVKLPGYTREKALADARGVIEFVKRKYEEVG